MTKDPPLLQPPTKPPGPLCSLHRQQTGRPRVFEVRSYPLQPIVLRAQPHGDNRSVPSPFGERSAVFGRARPARDKGRRRTAGRSVRQTLFCGAHHESCVSVSLPSYTRATGDRFVLPPPVGLLFELYGICQGHSVTAKHRTVVSFTMNHI
ncbi:uncharacterized protein LOC123988384 isoform X2 [Osmia bicornis bicornis]|uniref:uncharacterized protein LOC123988384 isoform X2 n=1 Tax=Osmia bicornis bicornis TaxID=1437191 RepID=UPI001EAEA144|nr:uncharacterized protein LOC123988384 isoform X2 [Osmia bicornis bicornis]